MGRLELLSVLVLFTAQFWRATRRPAYHHATALSLTGAPALIQPDTAEPAMPGWCAACWLLSAALCRNKTSATAQLHWQLATAGTTQTVKAQPVGDPYPVESVDWRTLLQSRGRYRQQVSGIKLYSHFRVGPPAAGADSTRQHLPPLSPPDPPPPQPSTTSRHQLMFNIFMLAR
jgi:hypothetical protein